MAEFLIQIEPNVDGMTPQADGAGFATITDERLREIGDEIHRMATGLVNSIKRDKLSPKQLSVEFGIGIKGEGGVPFFAKGSIETNFKVTAVWDWTAPE
jgi:hypothetical protein